MEFEWARDLARQTQGAGVALFVKQLTACGGEGKNGVLHLPSQFPEDLRVRQFPAVVR